MDIRLAEGPLAEQHANDVPQLVWSTGPIAYEFQFGDYDFYEAFVRESWTSPGTLFSAEVTHFAVDGGQLLGMEIGFPAPEFPQRRAACGACSVTLVERGDTTQEHIEGFTERVAQAAWLNPVTRRRRYYIQAIAVKPEHRGKGVGAELIKDAMRRGREDGCKYLELDVLSDNPAVQFYESFGLELYAETRAPAPGAFGVPPEYRMGRQL